MLSVPHTFDILHHTIRRWKVGLRLLVIPCTLQGRVNLRLEVLDAVLCIRMFTSIMLAHRCGQANLNLSPVFSLEMNFFRPPPPAPLPLVFCGKSLLAYYQHLFRINEAEHTYPRGKGSTPETSLSACCPDCIKWRGGENGWNFFFFFNEVVVRARAHAAYLSI